MRSFSTCLTRLSLITVLAIVGNSPSFAVGEVSGPIQIGPSWAQADAIHSTAVLSTTLVNHGNMVDRLIQVECPASGRVTLRNGSLHTDIQSPTPIRPSTSQQATGMQNGLDLPAALHGAVHPVTAIFDLSHAMQPLTDGALVPCTIGLAHGGERIVIFSIGDVPHPTKEP